MAWLIFAVSSAIVIVAASKLAQYGDVIAVRTNLGGMFIGTLLLAGATSLPEVITGISALQQGAPDLAAGNLYGSNMFNMFVLAVLDMVTPQVRILRQVAFTHALTAALAILLIGLAVFFMLAGVTWHVGWVGLDSILIMLVYVGGVRLIQLQGQPPGAVVAEPPKEALTGLMSLRRAIIGFALATLVLILVVPLLVSSSTDIAVVTGLGTGFVGTVLVAFVTSLPEVVAVIAAARIRAFDMAVGNLFGSIVFNMFALALIDLFYTRGPFIASINPAFALAGLLGLLLTALGLIASLARQEKRILFVEIDALLIILVYFAGLVLVYTRGLGV